MKIFGRDSVVRLAAYKDLSWWKSAHNDVTQEDPWSVCNEPTKPLSIPQKSLAIWFEITNARQGYASVFCPVYVPITKDRYELCSWIDFRRQYTSGGSYSHSCKGLTVAYNKYNKTFILMDEEQSKVVLAEDIEEVLNKDWTQYTEVQQQLCPEDHLWYATRMASLKDRFDYNALVSVINHVVEYLESVNEDYDDDDDCYDDDEE